MALFKTNAPYPALQEVTIPVKDKEEAKNIALIKGYSWEGFVK